MINLKNYAILAEQKKYGYFNRINEANGQTAENLKLVLSGENNDTYIKQWNQFMGDVEKNIQKDGTYTVKIKDNSGSEMVSINYTIINNELPEDTIVLTPGDSKNPVNGSALEKKAINVSKAIEQLFVPGSKFFSSYKNPMNDDDMEAADAFQKWFDTFHKRTVDSIKTDATNLTDEISKNINDQNATAITMAVMGIVTKMKGNLDTNNDVKWRIDRVDGTVESFEVDTDF